jgi:hypothetical protein
MIEMGTPQGFDIQSFTPSHPYMLAMGETKKGCSKSMSSGGFEPPYI